VLDDFPGVFTPTITVGCATLDDSAHRLNMGGSYLVDRRNHPAARQHDPGDSAYALIAMKRRLPIDLSTSARCAARPRSHGRTPVASADFTPVAPFATSAKNVTARASGGVPMRSCPPALGYDLASRLLVPPLSPLMDASVDPRHATRPTGVAIQRSKNRGLPRLVPAPVPPSEPRGSAAPPDTRHCSTRGVATPAGPAALTARRPPDLPQ
jgi:hypothetical protein